MYALSDIFTELHTGSAGFVRTRALVFRICKLNYKNILNIVKNVKKEKLSL
jgi:hypothetical protein